VVCSRELAGPEREEDAAQAITPRLPRIFLTILLVDVLFAAQYDDPEKQDRQYGTNDSNH
jgi:hypothetical protein